VFAFSYGDTPWSKIPGVWGQAVQRDPMQIQYDGGSQTEWPFAARYILDELDHAVELSHRVFRFTPSFLDRIVDERDQLRLAMSVVA
jgi:hypothetical protein